VVLGKKGEAITEVQYEVSADESNNENRNWRDPFKQPGEETVDGRKRPRNQNS
jgi:hypothetical protein